MRNFRMVLQYEGTRYQGWQRQGSTDNTIQGKLETLLSKMTGQKIEIQGAGRTDALLPYHRLGQDKYEGLGREYLMKDILPPGQEQMHKLLQVAESVSGLHCQIGG